MNSWHASMKLERSRNNTHLTQQESGKTYELTQRTADVDLTVAFIGVLTGTILVPLGVILPFLFFPMSFHLCLSIPVTSILQEREDPKSYHLFSQQFHPADSCLTRWAQLSETLPAPAVTCLNHHIPLAHVAQPWRRTSQRYGFTLPVGRDRLVLAPIQVGRPT
jgi:hypothetical protein